MILILYSRATPFQIPKYVFAFYLQGQLSFQSVLLHVNEVMPLRRELDHQIVILDDTCMKGGYYIYYYI